MPQLSAYICPHNLLCAALFNYKCVCAGLVQQPHMSCLHAAHILKQTCELRQGLLDISITEAAKAVPILHSRLQPEGVCSCCFAQKRCVVFMCVCCKAVFDTCSSIATCHAACNVDTDIDPQHLLGTTRSYNHAWR